MSVSHHYKLLIWKAELSVHLVLAVVQMSANHVGFFLRNLVYNSNLLSCKSNRNVSMSSVHCAMSMRLQTSTVPADSYYTLIVLQCSQCDA